MLQKLIDMAKAVNELRNEVNNVSARDDGPEVLLHKDVFMELFQTYTTERLCNDGGDICVAKICGVEFSCIVYDKEKEVT